MNIDIVKLLKGSSSDKDIATPSWVFPILIMKSL